MSTHRPSPRRTSVLPAPAAQPTGGLAAFLPTLLLLAVGLAGGLSATVSADAPPPVVDLVVTTGNGP